MEVHPETPRSAHHQHGVDFQIAQGLEQHEDRVRKAAWEQIPEASSCSCWSLFNALGMLQVINATKPWHCNEPGTQIIPCHGRAGSFDLPSSRRSEHELARLRSAKASTHVGPVRPRYLVPESMAHDLAPPLLQGLEPVLLHHPFAREVLDERVARRA